MTIRNRKRPSGGAAPFGYRWEGDVLVPHPAEAPVRRRIYELFVEHRNQQTVARLLNTMGCRTRRGAKFTITTVGRWLRDPLAKGHRLANVTVSLAMKKRRKLSGERALGGVQPIVSEELWNQASTILNAKRAAAQAAKRFHLFAGFTFCSCGRQMSVLSKSATYFCKRCRNRISIADLDRAFQDHLRSLFRMEANPRAPNPTQAIIKRKKKGLQTLSRENARVSEKMDKVYQAFIDDAISEQSFRRTYRPLEARLKQLGEEIPRRLGDLERLTAQCRPRDEILDEARSLYAGWQTLGEEEKRRGIQNLVKRITVARDSVRIDIC